MKIETKRRGPKTGYDFKAKEKYRDDVWKCFSENLDTKKAVVAFLPSKEGLEIPVALKYGFKEKNLIAIDENPALLATAKWRKEYPLIKCYGSKVGRAFERMANDGVRLHAANLDFCNNLSEELLCEVKSCLTSKCIRYGISYVSITMLEGRETHIINILADMISDESHISKRHSVMSKFLNNEYRGKVKAKNSGKYRSKTQTMSYTVFELTDGKYIEDIEKVSNNILKTEHDYKIGVIEYAQQKYKYLADEIVKLMDESDLCKDYWELDDPRGNEKNGKYYIHSGNDGIVWLNGSKKYRNDGSRGFLIKKHSDFLEDRRECWSKYIVIIRKKFRILENLFNNYIKSRVITEEEDLFFTYFVSDYKGNRPGYMSKFKYWIPGRRNRRDPCHYKTDELAKTEPWYLDMNNFRRV